MSLIIHLYRQQSVSERMGMWGFAFAGPVIAALAVAAVPTAHAVAASPSDPSVQPFWASIAIAGER